MSDLNVCWRWVEDCSHSFRRGLAVSLFPVESDSTNCAVRHHRNRCCMGSELGSIGINFRFGVVVRFAVDSDSTDCEFESDLIKLTLNGSPRVSY